MRKNQIDKLISSCNEMEQKIVEARRNLEMLQTMRPGDYSNPVDREQARESAEYTENEITWALLEVNKLTEAMVKKIDPEAWDER